MPDYVFAYHSDGKMPDSPEEGTALRKRFEEWVANMGNAMINPGTPMGPSKMVSSGGVSDSGGTKSLMGFSILRAESLDAAVEIAKDCPFLAMGTIEVAEAMEM